jgi:hypothetical protein
MEEFELTGLLRLPGAIPAADTREMRDALWAELARKHGIRRDAPESWIPGKVSGLQEPERAGAFARMASDALCGALDDLFAPRCWEPPPRWGSPLVTFPSTRGKWNVPNKVWHLDIGAGGVSAGVDEVIVFAILEDLAPGGGATVAVAGSHRLIRKLAAESADEVRSLDARRILARADPWLSDLWSRGGADRIRRYMQEGAIVEKVALRVVELTGDAGDVVIMNPSILHTVADNIRDRPRIVLRQGIRCAQTASSAA